MSETKTGMWWEEADVLPPGSMNARSDGCTCEKSVEGAIAYAHPDCEMHGNDAFRKWKGAPEPKKRGPGRPRIHPKEN